MAFTFDATPAGPGANSYATVTQAADLLAGRLRTQAWDAVTTTQRQQALVMATFQLDGLRFAFENGPAASEQARKFPRNVDPRDANGAYAIPVSIRHATVLHALALLADDAVGAAERLARQAQGVAAVRIGDVSEQYSGRTPAGDVWTTLTPEVRTHLQPFRDTAGRGRRAG